MDPVPAAGAQHKPMKNRGKKARSTGPVVETLQELRVQRGKTQVDLAEILTITQAALSKLERRTDVKVSTLRGYVEGLGGELSIVAKFGDRAIKLELPYGPRPANR